MTPSMQGFIIALLISLLVGVIIGFYLRQGRINALTTALQQSQSRTQELEADHEARLQAATAQLQKDYEAQLNEKIEAYQSQYESQHRQMEAEYQARERSLGEGSQDVAGGYGAVSAPSEATAAIEQRIRKQYESRLKEAAYKIQQAYEQHLQNKLIEAREVAQADYDQRLAQAIEHYQDDMEQRLAQALNDQAMQQQALGGEAALGIAGSEDQSEEQMAAFQARLQSEYDQRLAEAIARHQDELTQRTSQLEQDFAARLQMVQADQADQADQTTTPTAAGLGEAEWLELRNQLEADLRLEYEQKLAEKIEHYQAELTQRTQELEQSFESRLALFQSAAPEGDVSPGTPSNQEPGDLASDLSAFDLSSELEDSAFGTDLNLDLGAESMESSPTRRGEERFDLDHLDALLSDAVGESPEEDDELFGGLDDLSDLS
jgi:uncharacterized protein YlxW (UPF0749 family)